VPNADLLKINTPVDSMDKVIMYSASSRMAHCVIKSIIKYGVPGFMSGFMADLYGVPGFVKNLLMHFEDKELIFWGIRFSC